MPARFAICRLHPRTPTPAWAEGGSFSTLSRSSQELSIICEERAVPEGIRCDRGWRALQAREPLDFSLLGTLASLTHPLAAASIGHLGVSTFDTDYLLVREHSLEQAIEVLEQTGHKLEGRDTDAPKTADKRPRTGDRRQGRPKGRESATDTVAEKPTTEKTAAEKTSTKKTSTEKTATKETVDTARQRPMRSTKPAAEAVAEPRSSRAKASRTEAPRTEASRTKATEIDSGRDDRSHRGSREPRAESREPARSELKSTKTERSARDRTKAGRRNERSRSQLPRRRDPRLELVDEASGAAPSEQPESAASSAEPAPVDRAEREPKTPPRLAIAEPAKNRDKDDEEDGAEDLYTGAIPQHPVETTDESFEDLGLSEAILATVRDFGFEHPTPIQAAVIPAALAGHDIVGLAETGSGKTAAFALPLAERLTHGRGTRGLILCPTREIALQTRAFLDIFGRDHQLETVPVIGGVKMGPQIDGLRRGADIIVATPGRLADHMRRRNARLHKIEYLVLDEADHMLDLGFLPQIQEILEQVPEERQTMMFSATMPPLIARLTRNFMNNPKRIDFRPEGLAAQGIDHRLYLVDPNDKKACAVSLLESIPGSTLIFTRRKLDAEWLARQLEQEGVPVERIHSDRSQAHRMRALRRFREGEHRVLVATDVAARGIDIPRIQHVINYELPDQVEDYIHRAGRTARGSAGGIVSTIGTWQDKPVVRDIEDTLGIKIPRCETPGIRPYVELPKRKVIRRRLL